MKYRPLNIPQVPTGPEWSKSEIRAANEFYQAMAEMISEKGCGLLCKGFPHDYLIPSLHQWHQHRPRAVVFVSPEYMDGEATFCDILFDENAYGDDYVDYSRIPIRVLFNNRAQALSWFEGWKAGVMLGLSEVNTLNQSLATTPEPELVNYTLDLFAHELNSGESSQIVLVS